MKSAFLTIFISAVILGTSWALFPEQGKWDFTFTQASYERTAVKSLFQGSQIFIQVTCDEPKQVNVKWTIRESACWQEMVYSQDSDYEAFGEDNSTIYMKSSPSSTLSCSETVKTLPALLSEEEKKSRESPGKKDVPPQSGGMVTDFQKSLNVFHSNSKPPVFKIPKDGFYKLTVRVQQVSGGSFSAKIHVEMRSKDGGYLSAANWPLLPFYGVMSLFYLVFGLIWLTVSFLQWRDLLRIQFWIGGVIFLGMLEMATFYAEYSSFNSSGESIQSVVLFAEFVSCAKRTLARMLVIIVSLGFGIVKPRLGPMLHRVVGVGILYFIFAVAEAYMRVVRPKNDPANQFVIATVPLAVLDSAICWWIFISVAQTTRTLRLRRNVVKLALYRHFTNILIFAVVASVIFMLYSIKTHHLTVCFTDWKELWVDDAYWRFLFSVILLVIMILWRPTNNNQRYAFSPLLDAAEDDDDEEEQFVNDAYGVKMRGQSGGAPSPKNKSNSNNTEDDLKWVEENIPASITDTALPILDSDEEIMTTRFELSKMQ